MFKEDVHCSTAEVHDPGTVGGKVGGQLVVVRTPWKNCVTNIWTDNSKLGGAMILYLKTSNHRQLAIGNTYWPTKPITVAAAPGECNETKPSNPLWNKYVKWLKSADIRKTPITYLRGMYGSEI